MPELPSGTITFLFTDIERSTQTVGAIGDEAYADALDTHRQLLREAFETHGGHEVGTEGDAFFVAFARASDAVEAALAGQRALDAHALRVRMGIHTGEALVRQDDYVGHDVHKAKRIEDAGHGGQVLVSQVTAELVRDSFDLIDLGPHRLKDLASPERLYQVGTGDFPALRSLETFRTNLPVQRSSFVGREAEIAEVRKLLDGNRLVTLTGVGGCGKTRLSLQVAAEELDRFPGGVFFVNLAPISDPDAVPREVAASVAVPLGVIADVVGPGGGPADERVLSQLSSRTSLLVLDNCEHLVDACAGITDRILAGCPDVTILATSREALRVEGEQTWSVPSLSLPAGVRDAHTSESVSLFMARARAARPGFYLAPDNVDAVVEICRRLDGIPLAIEFAAARVSHLSPRQIADRLDDRFKLLTGGQRRVERQQTLQAALDWSFNLLDDREQRLLRRLSVFVGDFGIEAAEGACSDDELDAGRITDLIGSLVSKSLVEADLVEAESRYRLLESVRAYAAEKLAHADEAATFRTRHGDWYLTWIESLPREDAWFTSGAFRRIQREETNLLAALEWAAAEDRFDFIGRIMARVSLPTGFFDANVARWASLGLKAAARLSADDVLVLETLSVMADTASGAISIELSEAALEDASPGVKSFALSNRGLRRSVVAAFTRDDDLAAEAYRDFDEALRLADDARGEAAAYVLSIRSQTDMILGNTREAMYALEESIRRAEAAGNSRMAERANYELMPVALVLGERERAAQAWAVYMRDRRQHVSEADWDTFPLGWSTIFAALQATFEGADHAWSLLGALRPRVVRSGIPLHADDLVLACAIAHAVGGDHARASALLSWVRAHSLDAGRPVPSGAHYMLYLHYRGVVREALGPDEARRARDLGSKMSLEDALALAFEGREQG